jgi:dipeptidyl aminopeptidase/acylaminoacyl peptidase
MHPLSQSTDQEALTPEDLASIRPAGVGAWIGKADATAFFWADRSGATRLWRVSVNAGWPSLLSDKAVTLEQADGTDRRDVLGGPQCDPSGVRYAVTARSAPADSNSIWIINAAEGSAVELTSRLGDDYRTPRWSPTGTSLVCVRNRDGRDDIVLLDAVPGHAHQLTYDRWDNTDPDWSPDATRIAYISQRCDEDLFGSSVCVIPAEGGEPQVLTPIDGANDRSPRWAPDGSAIAFISDRAGADDVWVIAPDGSDRRPLTHGMGSKGDPHWSPDSTWILYTQFDDCDVRIMAVKANGSAVREVAVGGVNEAPRWSPDGTRILYQRSGPGSPPDLWLKPWDGSPSDPGLRLTAVAGSRLDNVHFSEPTVVNYESHDGLSIQALLYRPPERTTDSGRGIVYVRGGPNAVNTNGWLPQIQYLVQRGFTILVPNYRGSLGYGRQFMESNRFVSPGDDIDDWVASAQYLADLPEVDAERIAVMGRSYGGYATLIMLGLHPELFKVGVAIAAPSNWATCWEESPMPWMRRLQSWLMGRPTSHPDLYEARSPINYADKYTAPLLIIQGETDPAVPPTQATAMARRLHELGKQCQCHVYPGEAHLFSGPDAIIDSTRKIEAFLTEHV